MKPIFYTLSLVCLLSSIAPAAQVLVPDVGGTAQMPIQAPYPLVISAGLPPGSQINIDAVWLTPAVSVEQAGGTLGGPNPQAAVP